MNKEQIMNVGTCGLVSFHLVICGLPILAAITGIASPFAGFFSAEAMNILLVIAGISLVVSWVFYFRGCKCSKKLLLFSTILFTIALSLHFFIPPTMGVELCH